MGKNEWWMKFFEEHLVGKCPAFRLLHDVSFKMDVENLIAEAERRKTEEIVKHIEEAFKNIETAFDGRGRLWISQRDVLSKLQDLKN